MYTHPPDIRVRPDMKKALWYDTPLTMAPAMGELTSTVGAWNVSSSPSACGPSGACEK